MSLFNQGLRFMCIQRSDDCGMKLLHGLTQSERKLQYCLPDSRREKRTGGKSFRPALLPGPHGVRSLVLSLFGVIYLMTKWHGLNVTECCFTRSFRVSAHLQGEPVSLCWILYNSMSFSTLLRVNAGVVHSQLFHMCNHIHVHKISIKIDFIKKALWYFGLGCEFLPLSF